MIAIIKYNAGNTKSVQNALLRLDVESIITDDFETLKLAEKIIFPGVGEASTAIKFLKEKGLDLLIPSLKQPFLGICLGQQLMCKLSEEGKTNCLNIFDEVVKKFPPTDIVPHMGWNNLNQIKGKLFKGITEEDNFYFVHSYYVDLGVETVASCDYIINFSASLEKDNFFATQFHPEKSGKSGEKLLRNFIEL